MLSICIITKNEKENIGKCLEALNKYGFEIVVVDTGSTDGTKEIVKKYTDKVYDFTWCDDFSAAKNFAISKTNNEYVMVLDSDEFLELPKYEKIEDLYAQIRQYPNWVGRVKIRNIISIGNQEQEHVEWINRIFSRYKFHYVGAIHEQIISKDKKKFDTYNSPVVILHTGYNLSPEEKRKKAWRNIQLLEKELERLEQEGNHVEQMPYILYQLGKSHYMSEEYDMACKYFSKGLSYDLEPKLEYVIDMVETYGYALLNSGKEEEALLFENIYEVFAQSADFQFLMGLIYMKNALFRQAIEEFLKAVKQNECRMVGVNSYLAYYNVGVIYECLGNLEQAKKYYMMCGEYEPALVRC